MTDTKWIAPEIVELPVKEVAERVDLVSAFAATTEWGPVEDDYM